MTPNDPTLWAFSTWLLAIGMSVVGGLVNIHTAMKSGTFGLYSITAIIAELAISGFIGLLVFMGLDAFDQPLGLCGAAAGITGHASTRFLFQLEKIMEDKITTRLPK